VERNATPGYEVQNLAREAGDRRSHQALSPASRARKFAWLAILRSRFRLSPAAQVLKQTRNQNFSETALRFFLRTTRKKFALINFTAFS
jgi:hypothetical protein